MRISNSALTYRFWYAANDNGHRSHQWKQAKAPDYPGITRLEMLLAVLRREIDFNDFQ
jgi:hypothetical protein